MESYDGAEAIGRAWRDGLKPDPLLTVSEWADRYRVLSQRASSEPGRWRTDRTPYLKEIMDCLSPASRVQRVALMKGAQIGGHRVRQLLDRLRDPPGAGADDGGLADGGAGHAQAAAAVLGDRLQPPGRISPRDRVVPNSSQTLYLSTAQGPRFLLAKLRYFNLWLQDGSSN